MKCCFYNECQKVDACRILSECVFGHKMIIVYPHPQAKITIHYAKSLAGIVNTFRKIKRGKKYECDVEKAQAHLNIILNSFCKTN